ncbi:MAG TPA: hypothetical protein VLE72_01345 [Candidatus Saccharimonadales bacterium]|nr:hypothetical protein [Candidatus Saccharimonadales bacterium]
MYYGTVFWDDLPLKRGHFHPRRVAVIGVTRSSQDPYWRVGWVPNFAGGKEGFQIYEGNGDLAGDVCYWRGREERVVVDHRPVHIAQHPLMGLQTPQLALASTVQEHRGLSLSQAELDLFQIQLQCWYDLSPEDLAEICESQDRMIERLQGARDRNKVEAQRLLISARGVEDSLKRKNPGATAAKHLAAYNRQDRRLLRIAATQVSIAERAQWMNIWLAARLADESERLWDFLAERETLPASDVDEFYSLASDTLKPISQLVNWLCYELHRGGGSIEDHRILQAARGAFVLHQLSGFIGLAVQPVASLSYKRADANSERYYEAFNTNLERLERVLKSLNIGGPYTELGRKLHGLSVKLLANVRSGHWQPAIQVAREFENLWLYRSSAEDHSPKVWYRHTPPDPKPWELVEAYNQIEEPPSPELIRIREEMATQDPFDGLEN